MPGRGECVASQAIFRRFKDCTLGSEFKLTGRERFRVVGLFTAEGSPSESELWVDIGDLTRVLGREGIVSCVQVRASFRFRCRQSSPASRRGPAVPAGCHPRARVLR